MLPSTTWRRLIHLFSTSRRRNRRPAQTRRIQARARLKFESFEARIVPAADHWVGASGSWGDTTHWSLMRLPGSGDDVFIDGSGITVTRGVDFGPSTINSLTVGQNILAFTNSAITVAGTTTIAGTLMPNTVVTLNGNASIHDLTQSGGYLQGTGTITVTHALTWTGGFMQGSGTTVVAAGATLALNGSNGPVLSRALNNYGTATWTGTGSFAVGGVLTNEAGATFDAQGNANLSGGGTFNNAGTFRKSAGTGTTSLGGTFNNTGTVAVQSGTLSIGSGTSSGAFTVAAGTTLAFVYSTYSLSMASSITGSGSVVFSGDSATVGGVYNVGSTMILGEAVYFNTAARTVTATLDGFYGHLDGTGTFTVSGTLTWTGGTMSGSGATVIQAGGALVLSGTATKSLNGGHRLDNNGTTTMTGTGTFLFANGVVFNNQVGATFDAQGDESLSSSSGGGTLNNAGTFRKSVGTGTLNVAVPFNNSGTVQVPTGTISLNAGGSHSGTFTVAAGAGLSFGGGLDAFTAASSISGGGTVRFFDNTNMAGAYSVGGTTVTNGTVNFTGTYNVSGTGSSTTVTGGTVNFNISATAINLGAALMVSGGTVNFTTGATAINVGTALTITGGAVNCNTGTTPMSVGATLTVTNGFISFNGSVGLSTTTLTINNGSVYFNNGTAALAVSGAAALNAGTLGGSGTVTVSGLFTWSGGQILDVGVLNANGGLAISSHSAPVLTLNDHTINNAGAATWDGTGEFDVFNCTFNNRAGGSFTVQGDGTIHPAYYPYPLTFNNAGTFTKAAGTGTMLIDRGVVLNNTGTLQVRSGTLSFTGAFSNAGTVMVGAGATLTTTGNYTQTAGTTILSGGTLTAGNTMDLQGGILAGAGTVNGNITDAGQVSLGVGTATGILAINGNYVPAAAGRLQIKLNGTSPGTGYDQVNDSGTVNLTAGPMLQVSLGFTSAVGDTFTILTATTSLTGTFAGFAEGTIFTLAGARFKVHYTTTSVVLTHIAGLADHLAVVAPTGLTAGTPFSFTVTVQDALNDTVPDYTGTITFYGSDPQANLPVDYTFTAADVGNHTFQATMFTAGPQSLGAYDTANAGIIGEQDGIQVNPAAAVAFTVTGFPSPVDAGTPGSFTVTAYDAYGNVATGYTGTITFYSSDPQATLPADYTFAPADQGTQTFQATLFTAGPQSLGTYDTANAGIIGEQDGIQVNPVAATTLIVAGFPSPVVAGTPSNFTVTAYDAYGNVATGYTGTITFASSDPLANLPVDYTFTAADMGSQTFTATLNTPGTQSIGATDTANPGIAGEQDGIIVNGGGSPNDGAAALMETQAGGVASSTSAVPASLNARTLDQWFTDTPTPRVPSPLDTAPATRYSLGERISPWSLDVLLDDPAFAHLMYPEGM